MKRAILALVGTAAGLYALLGFKTEPLPTPTSSALSSSAGSSSSDSSASGSAGSTDTGGLTSSSSPSSASPSGTSTSSPSSTSKSSSTPSKASTSSSTTTHVTGNAIDTRYGPVQVQLTMQAGKITAVQVLQYPSGDGRDIQINNYALPVLMQETKQAQSANIDMVSGATFTSDGYIQSLQSALDKAK